MAQNTIEKPHVLTPQEALDRAVSDYLNISKNKNNQNYFRDHNYWPTEEAAWEKLQKALDDLS